MRSKDRVKQLNKWRARRNRIKELREAGMDFVEIGEKFGISRQRASQLYDLACKVIRA